MTSVPDARPPLDRAPQGAPARPPLDSSRLPDRVEVLPETGSTNAEMAARARAGAPAGSVLVTEHQVAGRGRLDRVWTTPARSALTFSLLLRPDLEPARWPWIPLATGYAVHAALAGLVPGIGLKWPNDVLVTRHDADRSATVDRKLAGILVERIETDLGPAAVIGIGLNVSLTEQERPVETATSILVETGQEPDRTELLITLLRSLDEAAALLHEPERLRTAYSAACVTIGREVRVELPGGGILAGRATGLDESGRLGVEVPGDPADPRSGGGAGIEWVGAGDVVHVR